ncbi:MAG: hypothetical protein RSB71_00915 [Bacilli bacterium]
MSKINIRIKINNEPFIIYQAIKINNKIIYNDNDCLVTLIIKDNIVMTRENKDYLISLDFINKQDSCGNCYLKKENFNTLLDIKTNSIIKDKTSLQIKYYIKTTKCKMHYELEEINDN